WVTGRRAVAVAALTAGVVGALAAWWWIGFHGLAAYPRLLGRLSAVEAPQGYAPIWHVGGTPFLLVCGLVGVAAIWFVRRDDRVSFAASVVVAIVLTPILWMHYLTLL